MARQWASNPKIGVRVSYLAYMRPLSINGDAGAL